MKTKMLKLSYKNNWEHITYSAGGKALANIKQVTILGKTYKVYNYKDSKDYGDMGHTYTANFKQYFIKHKVFKKTKDFTLQELLDSKVQILVDAKNIIQEEK